MNYTKLKELITNQFSDKEILQHAAMYAINFSEMVPQKLHDPEIDRLVKSEFDYNFLDLSAYYGSLEAFNYFLRKVPEQIIFKSCKYCPLIFYALKGKNDQIIEAVYQKGEEKEAYFKLNDGIFYSIKVGNIHYLNIFFEEAKKRDPSIDPEILLYNVFKTANQKPKSPLRLAIKSRSFSCVAFVLNISQSEIPFLLETKQNIQGKPAKKKSITPLHIASRYGCGDISHLLILLDSTLLSKKSNTKYFYPFVDVVKYNNSIQNYEDFFKHSKKDRILNLVDQDGNCALHYAVKNGNVNAVNILLDEKKIDVNIAGKDNKRPIHLAAQTCSLEILQRLLNHPNTDLEVTDEYDNLAVHYAAESNWAEGFLLLLIETAKRKKNKNEESIRNQISQKNEDSQNENSDLDVSKTVPQLPHLLTSADLLGTQAIIQTTNQNQDDNSPYTSAFPSRTTSSANYFSTSSEQSTEIHNYQETQVESSLKQIESSVDAFTNTNEENSSNSIIKDQPTAENVYDENLIIYIVDVIFKKNKMGLCCFHIAALKNCANIFDCIEKNFPLIAQKIYESHSGLTGFTVLHYLAMCGHSKLLEKIIKSHPSIDIDVQGNDPIVSALYQASKFNHEKCVKVLKENGASISKMTKRQRDKKTYIRSDFMNTLLFSNEEDLKGFKLDMIEKPQNPDSGFPISYEDNSNVNMQVIPPNII